jgi:hypothetical protein
MLENNDSRNLYVWLWWAELLGKQRKAQSILTK